MEILTRAELAQRLKVTETWLAENGPPPVRRLGQRPPKYIWERVKAWLLEDSDSDPMEPMSSESSTETRTDDGENAPSTSVLEIEEKLRSELESSERKSSPSARRRRSAEPGKKAG